jgi:peptide-methionine (S)-S-oxide reductase
MHRLWIAAVSASLGAAVRCPAEGLSMSTAATNAPTVAMETATFGLGCFWCGEAVFRLLPGVKTVTVGFMGGHGKATYKQVCAGGTGHAEVAQILFDPNRLRYDELLDLFWRAHDPTTPNRQGADVGEQYRSVIFYHSESQRTAAETSKKAADSSGRFGRPIVTQIAAAGDFVVAEADHQDYFRKNPTAPYCRAVIAPKVQKLKHAEPSFGGQ